MSARVALVTCAEARTLDEDLAPLADALDARGARAEIVDWRDGAVDWAAYDRAVVRSTWDYFRDLDAFLAWAAEVDEATRLLNPLPALRWSADKRYLADLDAAGVPIVPTRFVAPGEEPGRIAGDVVVKPAVGAGSNDAARFATGGSDAAAHVASITASGRVALVQPYLRRVDSAGETGMLFAGGRFSHAFRKGPILAGADVAFVDGLYAAEDISARVATEAEVAVGLAALAAAPAATAYARVDLIPAEDGTPCVLEVELVEPSLFLATDPSAAGRFAAAILTA